MMKLIIITDGASNGNPGPMGIGVVIQKPDGVVEKYSKEVGFGTNNEAELIAVKIALEKAIDLKAKDLEILSDSELVVKYIKGTYRCKKAHLKSILTEIMNLIKQFNKFNIRWISREQNSDADELANKACGIKQDICNLCGGKMLLRFRKKDGYPFYGCSKFPKCRNIINIPKEEVEKIIKTRERHKRVEKI